SAPLAPEGRQPVAALALADDRFPLAEFESDFLRGGELPVVVELIAAARRDDAGAGVHAQHPARHVDLVRAVVADLARPPAMEPVPVVMNHVVPVRGARCWALPQLVVEVGGDRRLLAPPDGATRVRVPGARQVGTPDQTFLQSLRKLDGSIGGALLGPHLDDAVVL